MDSPDPPLNRDERWSPRTWWRPRQRGWWADSNWSGLNPRKGLWRRVRLQKGSI